MIPRKSFGQGVRDGVRDGRQEPLGNGMQEGMREVAHRLLARRFGPLPRTAVGRLAEIRSTEELVRLAERAQRALSLAELGLA